MALRLVFPEDFIFAPPPDPARKKYPYLKIPEHLTITEFREIDDVCREFKSIDHLSERRDKIQDKIANKRKELTELTKSGLLDEDKLTKQEKATIRTRDPIRRKRLEASCKKIRRVIMERKERATALERDVIGLEEEAAEVEQTTQNGTIENARSLVRLCERVRGRRETEKQYNYDFGDIVGGGGPGG